MENKNYLSVSALVKYIKYKLENDEHLKKIYLRGEISNFVKHSRGHLYFSIKDEESQIRAVMFSSAASKLPFTPKEGDKVLVYGGIDLYIPSGSFSIQVWQMELDGIGNLYLAYEKLKKDLQEKGYFDEALKKKIPEYPNTIGIITSPTGAAIKDMIHTIERRYPLSKVILYPALVQGENAKYSIRDQIIKANNDNFADVLLVGRGGGSIEDLWAFNEMEVIEAIYQSNIPIISAVGHETDFTISDFVSDLRAPTPTGAAELATPDIKVLYRNIKNYASDLNNKVLRHIHDAQTKLVHIEQRLMNQNPQLKINEAFKKHEKLHYDLKRNYKLLYDQKTNELNHLNLILKRFDLNNLIVHKQKELQTTLNYLNYNFKTMLNAKAQSFELLSTQLKHQNPLKLMEQGYSFTLKDGKKIISIDQINIDDQIETQLKDGKVYSTIYKKEQSK